MSVYINQRKGKRISDNCLKYYLDKYREQFYQMENERRKQLRIKGE